MGFATARSRTVLNFKPLIFQNIYQLWMFYRIATYFRQWTKLQIIRSTRLCIFVKIDALIIDMIKCIPVYKLYWNSVEQNVSGKYSQIVVRGKIIDVTFLSNNVNRIVKNRVLIAFFKTETRKVQQQIWLSRCLEDMNSTTLCWMMTRNLSVMMTGSWNKSITGAER